MAAIAEVLLVDLQLLVVLRVHEVVGVAVGVEVLQVVLFM